MHAGDPEAVPPSMFTQDLLVDLVALREQVRGKYRQVAVDPAASFHFHTGRSLAGRLGYDAAAVGALPDRAVESFAGVGNPLLHCDLYRDRILIAPGANHSHCLKLIVN